MLIIKEKKKKERNVEKDIETFLLNSDKQFWNVTKLLDLHSVSNLVHYLGDYYLSFFHTGVRGNLYFYLNNFCIYSQKFNLIFVMHSLNHFHSYTDKFYKTFCHRVKFTDLIQIPRNRITYKVKKIIKVIKNQKFLSKLAF